MQEFQDNELLRQYVRENSNDAFAMLVSRHVNMVYSAALRKNGNPAAAEEVTQAVFVILAQKAKGLLRHPALSGWLYQATRLTAANVLRTEIRRARREQEAYMQSLANQPEPEPETWPQISPLLDDAMGRLGEKDRDTLALRFFEGKSFHEIGTTFGVSENAARKRADYALEKLRIYFSKRGVTSTAATIAGAISANSVHAAPAMLTKTVAAVALAKGATASASTLTLINGALKIMAWTKAKTAIVSGACVLLVATGTTGLTLYHAQKPMRAVRSDWSVLSGDTGQWVFADGQIEAHTITGDSILASSRKYGDFTFSANVKTANREASLAFRMQDATNGYILNFTPVGSPGEPNGFVRLRKRVANDETTVAVYQGQRLAATGKSAKIKVVAQGSTIQAFLNGANVLTVHDAAFRTGYLGLRVYGWEDSPCDATFSSVTFY